jgi:steroid 5-alpha reductase family enzyme
MPSAELTDLLPHLGRAWALCAVVMLALWAWQARRRDATPVDIAWAALLGALGVMYALTADGAPERRALVGVLALSWSARLAGWLAAHRLGHGRGEDPRYRDLRARWGGRAQANFLVFFQAQGLLDVILSLTFLLACLDPRPELGPWEVLGGAVAALSIAGEAAADLQLERFKRRPDARGRTCRDGLWRYSRHPNYFFEWSFWVGMALIALPAPHGWLGLASPAIMLTLIWKVTGIPAAEAQAVKSRGQDYLDYQRTTSAFVPWFPRTSA